MIVIRKDKDDTGKKVKKKKEVKKKSFIPFLFSIVIFLLLFLLIPIGLVLLLHLPWYLSIIYPVGIVIGAILIILGVIIIYHGIKGLRLRYSRDSYEKMGEGLVTTGIYAHTRNPMYFGAIIMILGWFIVFPFTFILISTFLFLVLFYITAKSEEKQLIQTYGKTYLKYKSKVPLFIPYSKIR
jgi:protein-S-isoprenylcysteine O-methyltransferase Ste14